ncbi:hypothetical protein GJ689_17095 [Rhodoplanes serenus]|uniref:Uncharacterized protein n=1 Tax=Rhodoplanes serenus TaxID=200615 RepID=A0A9X5AT26_9BRAD|nr:hypothetical protein [Rhodoplanes serenus]MTW17926.1 hypothetical protein [Rhodoplanes serenus]
MAGDLNFPEYLSVLDDAAAALSVHAAPRPLRFVHRYGDRVLIGTDPVPLPAGTAQRALTEASAPGAALPADLDETERLGVEAFQLRLQPEFLSAKQQRPRDGQPWNMQGCTDVAQALPEAARAALAAEAAAPTSAYLEGSVAVGIVIVEGPTADLQFSAAERTKVVAEVQNGLSWLAAQNSAAGISFSYDIRTVRIATPPNPGAADLEAVWRDPAMAALGYTADWNGVVRYVEDNRTRFRTRWTYVGFFTKYPLFHFAYASIGGPRLVMDYANDGWGPDNIDRVFTHESGHVFGCPDEYAASGCTCGGSWGRFGRPNSNCENCAPGGGVACLMKANTFAMCNVTPAHLGWLRPFPPVRGNPVLIQGRFGTPGNFELLVPGAADGLLFSWRDNSRPEMFWALPLPFGLGAGAVDGVGMIQSNFGSPGNLEAVARVGDRLHFYWRDSGPAFRWNGPFPLFGGARGNPVLIQSRFGSKGNFELAVPAASGGGFLFAWRNNDVPAMPWSAPVRVGGGEIEALTLIQSRFGSPGNLELIARVGDRLHFYWRDSGPAFRWNGPFPLFGGARGNPVLIQSRFGSKGNFELAVPAASGGGFLFAWRNNDVPAMPWSAPMRVGRGEIEALTLIQSSFGTPGNLELIARVGDRLDFYWRDSGPAFRWNGPFPITTLP